MSFTKQFYSPADQIPPGAFLWEGRDDADGQHYDWLEDDDNFCPYCGHPEMECCCTDLDYHEPEQEEEETEEKEEQG